MIKVLRLAKAMTFRSP